MTEKKNVPSHVDRVAFVGGSRAFGAPREDSDVDLVVRISTEDAAKMEAVFVRQTKWPNPSFKIGQLNLICATNDEEYDVWRDGTEKFVAEKRVVPKEESHSYFPPRLNAARAGLKNSTCDNCGRTSWGSGSLHLRSVNGLRRCDPCNASYVDGVRRASEGLKFRISTLEQSLIDRSGVANRYPVKSAVTINCARPGYTEHSPPPRSGEGEVVGYVVGQAPDHIVLVKVDVPNDKYTPWCYTQDSLSLKRAGPSCILKIGDRVIHTVSGEVGVIYMVGSLTYGVTVHDGSWFTCPQEDVVPTDGC